jgi:ATP-binding cassette subfamily B protein
VRENIALGDCAREVSGSEVASAARQAEAEQIVRRLPEGYESLLGKWFSGGTELSTGEWQRLALARAFLRHAPVLVLDEPTSAMDPWAEAEWLRRFRELARGRTVLIITHRFSTAIFADTICVMDRGKIVESGTHADLLGRNGRYAQAFRTSSQEAKGA